MKGEKTLLILLIYNLFFFAVNKLDNDGYIPEVKLFYASYTFFEYLFFSATLFLNIQNKQFRNLMIILSFSFVAFQIFYFFTVINNKPLDPFPIGIESILILIYSFYFFYEQLKNTDLIIYENYLFWITIGVVLYLSGSFFFNILSTIIPHKELVRYWFVTHIFDTIKNLLFVISVIAFLKQKDSILKPKHVVPHLN